MFQVQVWSDIVIKYESSTCIKAGYHVIVKLNDGDVVVVFFFVF